MRRVKAYQFMRVRLGGERLSMLILLLIGWVATLFNEKKAVGQAETRCLVQSCLGRLLLDSVLSQGEDA